MMFPKSRLVPNLVLNLDDVKFLLGSHYNTLHKSYFQKRKCPHCHEKAARFQPRTSQLTANNEIRMKGHCTSCNKERHVVFDIDREYLCSERADFLRELRQL